MKTVEEAKMLTDANKGGDSGAAELKQAALLLDPLGVTPDVGHLLPKETGPLAAPNPAQGGIDLIGDAKRPESGAVPLRNRRREEFCKVLTGWGGDGLAKKNHEAYEAVYGAGGATARVNSSRLLAEPEVKERVEWMERKVAEARRHDYRAARQEIDELRLGIIERAKKNSQLAAVALAAARDFEAAHGLNEEPTRTETTEIRAVEGDALTGVRAVLAKVIRKTE